MKKCRKLFAVLFLSLILSIGLNIVSPSTMLPDPERINSIIKVTPSTMLPDPERI
jgi:hypothetical protein